MHEQLIPLYALAAIFSLYTLWGIVRYLIDERRAKAASRAERDWAELFMKDKKQ